MSDEFGMPMVDCRPAHEVIAELRHQLAAKDEEIASYKDLPIGETYRRIIENQQATIESLRDQLAVSEQARKESDELVLKQSWKIAESEAQHDQIQSLKHQLAERENQNVLLRDANQPDAAPVRDDETL
jgi:DNA-directed RNA polymerase specialized sigma subunit